MQPKWPSRASVSLFKNLKKPRVFTGFWLHAPPEKASIGPRRLQRNPQEPILGHLAAFLSHLWGHLGPSWVPLGPSWSHLGEGLFLASKTAKNGKNGLVFSSPDRPKSVIGYCFFELSLKKCDRVLLFEGFYCFCSFLGSLFNHFLTNFWTTFGCLFGCLLGAFSGLLRFSWEASGSKNTKKLEVF